ncbi:hypothetical protein [Massilia sp. DWR3-1-1]|uniref:hypothetical protein n=1 Tax=Massilia sp. DWR3-1-1 TaxID=2804559 RepID=UPI003CE8323A
MKHLLCLAAALAALLAGLASDASGQARPADPADADAPVPPIHHRPALAPAALAPTPPPLRQWPALNALVGAYQPMAPAPAATPATPATPAPALDPHAHHKGAGQ